jgi:hypothetical protein
VSRGLSLVQAQQRRGGQRNDSGIGIGQHHPAPFPRGVSDDHRACRQLLQLMLLHQEFTGSL